LKATLSQLDALRSLLIKRDDVGLDQLLGEIRDGAEARAENERLRQALRADLARAFDCEEGQLTLSQLRLRLPAPHHEHIVARQAALRSLAERLQHEYTLTALLVSDCVRFNRTLLRAFFGAGARGSTTYSPDGSARHRTNTTLMSLQL
jgi:hypothetical protein